MANYAYITTIGQDSHRFLEGEADSKNNTIKMGGIDIPFNRCFSANSDGDVVLHAITNAISGYTCINILGGVADKMCLEQGIKDSAEFLKVAMNDLKNMGDAKVYHVSLSIECLRPKLMPHIPSMRSSIANLLGIPETSVGITATTGEGLTGFGKGEGIQVLAMLTIKKTVE